MTPDAPGGHVVKVADLPHQFPTSRHSPEFWEALGRTVATYGFLEEVLLKALFAFTGTRSYSGEEEAEAALPEWVKLLEKALPETLGFLISAYDKAVRDHGGARVENYAELISDLRGAAVIRNVLCHGSWRLPDDQGRSVPFFFNRRLEKFDSPVDIKFLSQTQRHVAELSASVISSVTHMGWQFPGSTGPGTPVWQPKV